MRFLTGYPVQTSQDASPVICIDDPVEKMHVEEIKPIVVDDDITIVEDQPEENYTVTWSKKQLMQSMVVVDVLDPTLSYEGRDTTGPQQILISKFF